MNLFLTVLDAGKSKFKVLADSVSAEGLLPGSHIAVFSLCPHTVEAERELSEASFRRVLIPFTRTPPYDPITSQSPTA